MALALAFGAALACPWAAHAQRRARGAAAAAEPGAVRAAGAIVRYVRGRAGGVRGFVLDNGAVVIVERSRGDALARRVAVGQTVRVSGLATRRHPRVIFHATVTAPDGTVFPATPPAPRGDLQG